MSCEWTFSQSAILLHNIRHEQSLYNQLAGHPLKQTLHLLLAKKSCLLLLAHLRIPTLTHSTYPNSVLIVSIPIFRIHIQYSVTIAIYLLNLGRLLSHKMCPPDADADVLLVTLKGITPMNRSISM